MHEVSLILCTRNRGAFLKRTLDSIVKSILTAGCEHEIEVIIVDNGSSDQTPHVLNAFAQAAPFTVTIVHEQQAGLSVARNTGLKHSNGTLIVFTDDDCELTDQYFIHLLSIIPDKNAPVLIGGKVELGDQDDLPLTIKTDLVTQQFTRSHAPAGFIHGCNMAASRKTFETIGVFDQSFGAGGIFRSGEDTDLTIRAFLAGITIEYRPEIVVKHFHGRRSIDDASKLVRQYEFGNGALLAKHGLKFHRLVKSFLFNAKDSVRERLGHLKPIDAQFGIGRSEILACHILGAANYMTHRIFPVQKNRRGARAMRNAHPKPQKALRDKHHENGSPSPVTRKTKAPTPAKH